MRMIILLIILILTLNACAPSVRVLESSSINAKAGMTPKIDEQSTVPVGGIIITQFKYSSKIGYRLKDNLSVGFKLGQIIVAEGDFVIKGELEKKIVFCSENLAYIDPWLGPSKIVCFIDENNDGMFEIFKAAPGPIWFESKIVIPLPYEKSELILPRSDAFRYELLYQGTSKGSLKVLYREYLNDLVRPAFSQDITYDITSSPTMITFRNVKIEVLNADNNKIIYRILSGF